MFGLSKEELRILKSLSTPIKIQDFLDTLAINHEKKGETYQSPRLVLQTRKAHCLEGALLACVALWLQGEKPLILDLQAPKDTDHVVALYRKNGYWGAISKTNHATLRFRDPIYKTLRELALSYFHEYTNNETGEKTLTHYSTKPFDLRGLDCEWVTTNTNLQWIAQAIDDAPHTSLVPPKNKRYIRNADKTELIAGSITEWEQDNPLC